jgi:hypothetical protein
MGKMARDKFVDLGRGYIGIILKRRNKQIRME